MPRSAAWKCEQVVAARIVRKIGRWTPSFLIEDRSGRFYNVNITAGLKDFNHSANEWLGCAIARAVGLPTPQIAEIHFSHEILEQRADIVNPGGTLERPIQSGVRCGIEFVGDLSGPGRGYHHLNSTDWHNVQNKFDFLGIDLFDQWAGNCQPRRAVFLRSHGTRKLQPTFVDYGCLFGGACWDALPSDFHPECCLSQFPVQPDQQTSFEWSNRLKSKIPAALSKLVPLVPRHWCLGDPNHLHRTLLRRLDSLSKVPASAPGAKWFLPLSMHRFRSWRVP